jgi:DUF1680 family protein
MASLGGYIYAKSRTNDEIYVNLFVGSNARVALGDNTVVVRQDTRYPWDGRTTIRVEPQRSASFAVYVRMPGWTSNEVMPGDLYKFTDQPKEPVTLTLNGQRVEHTMVKGFVRIARRWNAGDAIELTIPMPVRRVVADDRVKENAGRLALERGPLVYAAEWPDNDGHALNLVVADGARLTSAFRQDLLNGVEVVTGEVQALERDPAGGALRARPHQLVAIPYYAWANRGPGEMQVWMARSPDKARVTPVMLPSPIARVRSSGGIDKKWTG